MTASDTTEHPTSTEVGPTRAEPSVLLAMLVTARAGLREATREHLLPAARTGAGRLSAAVESLEGFLVPRLAFVLAVALSWLGLRPLGLARLAGMSSPALLDRGDRGGGAPTRAAPDAPSAPAPVDEGRADEDGVDRGTPGDDAPRSDPGPPRTPLTDRLLPALRAARAWFARVVVSFFVAPRPADGVPDAPTAGTADPRPAPLQPSGPGRPLPEDDVPTGEIGWRDRILAAFAPESTQPLAAARALPAEGFGRAEEHVGILALVGSRLRAASASAVGLLAAGLVVLLLFTEVTERTVLSAAERAEGSVGVELIKPDEVRFPELEQRSEVFDREGQSLAVLDREVNRQVIPLDRIPEHVRQAVIATEDRRFYEHRGYDPEGIARALRTNVQNGGVSGALSGQGGSTLTQQLAKSLVGTQDSVERKVTELTYAMRLEEEYTKDELLEQYLNQVYFGANAYGVAAAAEEYFRTTPEALTVPQSALIAGLISVPNNANPRTEPEKAKVQRDTTLDAMAEEGYITVAEAEQFAAQPLGVAEPLLRTVELPFVVQAVQNEFLTSPRFAEFGETLAERQEALDFGGLKITATIDPRLQQVAASVLSENFGTDPEKVTGAIATVEPVSGKILAAQGALGYDEDNFDLATQGRRQPGSTFKPFIYATALQQGLPVGIQLEGKSPSYYEDVPGWTEEDEGIENYGDRSYPKLDMRAALRGSVNTAAAQLIQIVGPQSVWETADAMGIDMLAATRGADGEPIVVPAIGLGGLERGVSPLEMATAFATFANDGIAVEPTIIERITDQEGDVLYNGEPLARRVLDSRVNATMVSMMTGVVTGGTGTGARISGWQVAGKTGTTQRSTDAWFVGYTPTLSTAMWMGYKDDNRLSTGQTGGGKPAGVWRQYMVQALAGTTPVGFPEISGSDSGSGRLVAGQPVTVPDIRRLTATEAYRTLLELKLIGQRVDVGSEAPAGTVLWQSPRAGTAAETGDEVRFGVSTGRAAAPEPEEGSSSDSSDSDSSDSDSSDADSSDADSSDSDSSDSDSSDSGSSDSSSESGDATGSASDSIELPAEDTGD